MLKLMWSQLWIVSLFAVIAATQVVSPLNEPTRLRNEIVQVQDLAPIPKVSCYAENDSDDENDNDTDVALITGLRLLLGRPVVVC